MRWDVIFYCLISLIFGVIVTPIIGPELQIGALVAAVWLSFLPD
jgi:hypothetical protein